MRAVCFASPPYPTQLVVRGVNPHLALCTMERTWAGLKSAPRRVLKTSDKSAEQISRYEAPSLRRSRDIQKSPHWQLALALAKESLESGRDGLFYGGNGQR